MTTIVESVPMDKTLGDLLKRLGNISPDRVRLHPAPGTATEMDVIGIEAREDRLCELVDGVLVEKGMGYWESVLAMAIGRALGNWVTPRKLGVVSGEAGMTRLFPGMVRIPDAAYASWERFPGGKIPEDPIPRVVPDLVVEVLSESNTDAEMRRKRAEYFQAGVRLVWIVDAKARSVTVYTGPQESIVLDEVQSLDGGEVLPGFTLSLRELFAGGGK